MRIDQTALHHRPGASAGRGPPWLMTAGPQAKYRRVQPYHSS
jgi:hypothetical protein